MTLGHARHHDPGRPGRHPHAHGVRAALAALALGVLVALLAASPARGQGPRTPHRDIATAGPLNHVHVGNELGCQVSHTADRERELFPPEATPGDCGTLVWLGQNLYAPDFPGHGATATSKLGDRVPWTPVSQSPVEGEGTAASPARVTTHVRAGSTGLEVVEVDSYVVGQELYRTDVTLRNVGSATLRGVLYRAGDCYLQGSDEGFGFVDQGAGAVGCSENPNNSPGGRVVQWYPITRGNEYFQAHYEGMWRYIGTHRAFPNTCQCTTRQDNAAGLSWQFSLTGGESRTYSHYTVFSPGGATGPGAARPSAFSVVSAPSNRRCVSRRKFRIRVRNRSGLRVRQATVYVNGRRVAVRRGRRLTAPVNLRGLPRGRFRVRIRAVLTNGQVITGTRRYRTCTRKRRGRRPRT